jgi:quinoprotein glucose dehydrogenase
MRCVKRITIPAKQWLPFTIRVAVRTALLVGALACRKQAFTEWNDYAGSPSGMQYSALRQIDKGNVGQLRQAWFYLVPGTSAWFGYNPLIKDGMMYILGEDDALIAIDAATGRKIWTHRAEGRPTDRGINYWESKDRSDRRLILRQTSYLQEINAKSGVAIPSFGNDGRVNLREGLGRDPKTIPQIQSGTPGRVFGNMIIQGSATSEAYGAPPGDIRAYDVLARKLLWTFHTASRPGEFAYDTWPPAEDFAWKAGKAAAHGYYAFALPKAGGR